MVGRTGFAIFLIVIFAVVGVWLYGERNYAYLQLNHGLAAADQTLIAKSKAIFLRNPQSARQQYGLATIYFAEGREREAAEAWLAAGETVSSVLIKGEQLAHSDIATALRWYRLAEQIAPEDAELWLAVGRLCQPKPWLDPICKRFLSQNGQNMLVNGDFTFDRTGWQTNLANQVVYEIGECKYGRCASWEVGEAVPALGATMHQCLYLEANKWYRFSAFIKVEVAAEVGWRPVYVQGSVAGDQVGMWPHTQLGARDWQEWEHVLQAPAFEGGLACFHPIRLEGSGRVWVAHVQLIELSDASN